MGQFQFEVPEAAGDFFSRSMWSDAYISGMDGVPWFSETAFDGKQFSIQHGLTASGKLNLTWPVPEIGLRSLSTCSLRGSEAQSYQLPLELARGSCYRARAISDAWERFGLTLCGEFHQLLQDGSREFLEAAKSQSAKDRCAESALKAIPLLEKALDVLAENLADQSIAFRKKREPQLGTLLAGSINLDEMEQDSSRQDFMETFNAAAVRFNWRCIEEQSGKFDFGLVASNLEICRQSDLRVIAGPLVDFRDASIPAWLQGSETNFDSLLNAAVNYVEKAVSQFRGSVQLWNCAAGLNTAGPLEMDDEQVMRLSLAILQAVRRVDPTTPAIMSFDQPFGEYLSKNESGVSPLKVAETLVRSGLGLAGIGLDYRIGYLSNATMPRSPVDFSLALDRWGNLGIPTLVQLTIPGETGPDTNSDFTGSAPEQQLKIARPLLQLLLAKPSVHGIVWNDWANGAPHQTNQSSFLGANGQPRPLQQYLMKLRQENLT